MCFLSRFFPPNFCFHRSAELLRMGFRVLLLGGAPFWLRVLLPLGYRKPTTWRVLVMRLRLLLLLRSP